MSTNPEDYELISYDFDSIQADIISRLKAKSEFENISEDDVTFKMITYMLTYGITFLCGSMNNTFIDSFPHISSADEALYFFADFIKMSINRKISAEGEVTFSLSSIHNEDIVIAAGTEVSNADNSIIFTTTEAKTLSSGSLSVDVDVIQGQWQESINTSTGENFQRYYIYDDVENVNLEVYVKPAAESDYVEWTKADNFFFSTDTDNHFCVKNVVNGIYILFSDDVFGKKPAVGDSVNIRYLVSKGLSGNIYSANLLTEIVSTLTDEAGTNVNDILSVTNALAMTDGTDEDSISTIKANVTRHFITNPYITRKTDYSEYLLQNSVVRDCNVYAGWEITDDTDYWTTIYIYVVPKNSQYLTDEEKSDLFDYLKLKDFFLAKTVFEDVTYIGVNVDVTIKFKDSDITQTAINEYKDDIETIIDDYFDFEEAMTEYGTVFRNIYESEITEQIMDITALRKCNIQLQAVESISEISENVTNYSKTMEFNTLKESETYLYLSNGTVSADQLIGTFDDTWVLVPETAWSGKIGASINESNSTVSILVIDTTLVESSDPDNIIGDSFYLRTNAPSENDDLLQSSENMVFELYDKSITTEI